MPIAGSRYFSTDGFLLLNMIKIDLHTHSIISPDGAGSITKQDFKRFLTNGILDCIAITDHNETRLALELHKELGDRIIVGEEITTRDGEMIGLFLQKTISPGLSAKKTAEEIHKQGGLVYIPHPFETFRKGIQKKTLEKMIQDVDIFEAFNGRGRFRGKTKEAALFAEEYQLVIVASSDAHGSSGIGNTYTVIDSLPTRGSLSSLLQKGQLQKNYASLWTYAYPAVNFVRHKVLRMR